MEPTLRARLEICTKCSIVISKLHTAAVVYSLEPVPVISESFKAIWHSTSDGSCCAPVITVNTFPCRCIQTITSAVVRFTTTRRVVQYGKSRMSICHSKWATFRYHRSIPCEACSFDIFHIEHTLTFLGHSWSLNSELWKVKNSDHTLRNEPNNKTLRFSGLSSDFSNKKHAININLLF